MKRLILIITVVVASMSITAAFSKERKGEGKITFREYVYDFGNVPEKGGVVSHEFIFVNEGNGSIAIKDATATCGCTRPEYPLNPIAPGKKGKIKVSYNPLGRPGPIDRVVTVKTTGSPRKVLLKLKGNVIPSNK